MQKINYKELSLKKQEEVKTFVSFLKSNRLYSAYIRNLKNSLEKESVEKVFNRTSKASFLSSAFTWRDTPKGYDLWADINDAWWSMPRGK